MAYEIVSSLLHQLDADVGASEAHGIASGMLCVDIRTATDSWLNALFANKHQVGGEALEILTALFEQTRQLLDDEDEQFEFDLLLPDDTETLSLQAEALSAWCQGFLLGIGYSRSNTQWPGECGEILRDIVEFTKLETDVSGEENEAAFVEIHEYLRSAILIIRDQLLENDDQPTLH